MTVATIELRNELFSSPVETAKDKVLSLRVEEAMYKLVEDIAQEIGTETVSATARKILRFYLLNAIYEEEWKKLHSKDFDKFLKQVEETGELVELENYRDLLAELSKYVQLMRAIIDRINISATFFESEMSKLEEVSDKLEQVDIIFDRGINKGKSKK
jgi:hypothetical protein